MYFQKEILISNEKQNIDGGLTRTGERATDVQIYDSLAEAAARMDEAVKALGLSGSHMHLGNKSFTGRRFSGTAELKQAVNEQWSEGVQRVDQMVADLERGALPRPRSRRRVRVWDEMSGDDICLDRLRSGEPFWQTTQREQRVGPSTITVLADVGCSWKTGSWDVLWRGAAAVAMTLILERAGYQVELWVYSCGQNVYMDGTDLLVAVNLKRSGDPLDRVTLVNAVSAWVYRNILFALKSYSEYGRTATSGLGRPKPLDEGHLDLITTDEKRVVIEQAFSYRMALGVVEDKISELDLD